MAVIKFRLRVQLALHDMNQKQLSEITGIRPSTVSAICTGSIKELPVGVLNRVCSALGCQPGDLMEYIPDEE
ncbi:MAG: helix-turn-helix transcriptional regulator [Eubacteriales bacterium]|nr:helix-turn-helix transcriptional regulator [Eubacteriales bacterium]MDY4009118.1 helix-turn-helix transcriptional regulator [Candidatus Limiplasma sp.]